MTMLINSISAFINYIPTAAGSEWDVLEPFVESAQIELTVNLLGTDLNTAILALDGDNSIRVIANKLLAFSAYHAAIPFVDLSQTANGFAVVNNNNLSPASKERVERLIEWCRVQIDKFTDMLIVMVRNSSALLAKWKLFAGYNELTDCFFLTGTEFSKYVSVKQPDQRTYFLEEKPLIVDFIDTIIAPVISRDYVDVLLGEFRNNVYTKGNSVVVDKIKLILAALWRKETESAGQQLQKLSTMLDNDTKTYAVYAASDEYELKHRTISGNEAEHTTFFFGR